MQATNVKDWVNEKAFQQSVMQYAEERDWLVHHCYSAKYCSGIGFPDLVMVRDGQILVVELKSEMGVLKKHQLDWLQAYPDIKVWRPSMWDDIQKILY